MRTFCLACIVVALVALEPARSQETAHTGATDVIAFIRGQDVWIMNGDGSGQRKLSPGVNFDWAPDGKRIAVLRTDGIFAVDVDSGAARRLARGAQIDWSPDGRRIAFVRNGAVHVVGADGRGLKRLTAPPRRAGDSEPEWSPDGRRIAWVRTFVFTGGGEVNRPFVMNADGSGQRMLTRKIDPYAVKWAPDGRRLVAACWVVDDYDTCVVAADGSSVRNLTPVYANDSSPEWSPDGSRIAFTGQIGPDTSPDVYVMQADGTRVRRLTSARGFDGAASWSPDGGRIAFISERDGSFDIYVMTAAGRRQTNLTRDGKRVHNTHPVWSPARR